MLFYFFTFLFGLIVGSFLNSIVYRLEIGESFLFKRSYCPHCKHRLAWQDLIPVLSFFFLKGKCRYCQSKISFQYPLVETATGLMFLLIFIFFFPPISEAAFFSPGELIFSFLNLFFYWAITSFLIVIFVYDLKHYIIPDKMIYPAIVLALLFNSQFLFFNEVSKFNLSILSGLGAAAFFLLIVLLSKGKWMGMGDVKLAFLMGLLLSFPNILIALFLSFFFGAIIGVGLILADKKTLKSEVPFGPFLIVGTFTAMFWGEKIVSWYLSFFP